MEPTGLAPPQTAAEEPAASSPSQLAKPGRFAAASTTFRALKHRNFQLYQFGQLFSVAGTWMQMIAQGWLVFQLSHSERTLGIVAFASAIPALMVSPWTGVVVDRVPRRTVLVITQVAAMVLAFSLALLTFTGAVQVWHIVVLASGLGLVNAFDGPARQAFVVEMVGREDLTNAIALNSMIFNGARIVGPALGGVLLATLDPGWCFLLNGLSYIATIGGLLAMRLERVSAARVIAGPWLEFTNGLRYVWQNREQLALLSIATIFAIFGLTYGALLPAFAERVLHTGAAGYGLLNAATGTGSLIGALIIAATGGAGRRGQLLASASLAFPVVLLVFAFTPVLAVSIGLALGLGLLFMLQITLINTLLQMHVSDEMRGRVLSLFILIFFGLAPLGHLAAGSAAEQFGLSATIAACAVLTELLVIVVLLLTPRVWKLR